MIGGLVDIMGMLSARLAMVDVGFLSGSQVDRFGNINTTVIGPYGNALKPGCPAAAGANPIGSAWLKRPSSSPCMTNGRLAEQGGFHHHSRVYRRALAPEKNAGMSEEHRPGHALITNKAVLQALIRQFQGLAYLASYHPGQHH